MEEIYEIYPEARVIHIIRDGRDQAVSFIHQQGNRAKRGRTHRLSLEELAKSEAYRRSPRELAKSGEGMFAEKTLRKAAQNWALRVGQAIEDGPALFGDRYAEVRYEDLLERPNEEVEKLLGFLGVDTDERLVEHCVSSASFEKLSRGASGVRRTPPPSIGKALRVTGNTCSTSATSRSTKRPGSS